LSEPAIERFEKQKSLIGSYQSDAFFAHEKALKSGLYEF